MHERRYSGDITRLRSAERVERLEVKRVVGLCAAGGLFTNVLDAGTGSGLFAEGFMMQGLKVTGMDANPLMPVAARSYVPYGNFLQATAESLPFHEGVFELAFYGFVLHEADDALLVLNEAFRVTSQRVCILEWPYREQSFGPPLGHRLSQDRLVKLFRASGFKQWKQIELTHTQLFLLEHAG
jgi:ubiquinone/menaquinone biosynthesis C-methylase UbiE